MRVMTAFTLFPSNRLSLLPSLFLFLSYVTPAAAQDPVESLVDPEAMVILQRAAQHMSDAERFSVAIGNGYDTVQPNGQKIEFGYQRQLLVDRPGQLRVDVVRRTGMINTTTLAKTDRTSTTTKSMTTGTVAATETWMKAGRCWSAPSSAVLW